MAHRSISSGRWPDPVPVPTLVPTLVLTVVPTPEPVVARKAQVGRHSPAAATDPDLTSPVHPVVVPQDQVLTSPAHQAAEHPQPRHPEAEHPHPEAEAEHPQHPHPHPEAEAEHPQHPHPHPEAEAEAEHPQARRSICTPNGDESWRNRGLIAICGSTGSHTLPATGRTRNTGITRSALRSYIA